MRVLVTGASSLLGRVTVERLRHLGHVVTVFQRGQSGLDAKEVRGDICSSADVGRAVVGQEAVIHLAAKVSVGGAWDEFEQINVSGTARLIDAARSAGIGRMVHVSSPSVVPVAAPGRALRRGTSALVGSGAGAADPSSTRGHYSTSKAQAEILALAASSAELPIVAVRPHLVWGPGDVQLVGRIVERARAGRLALIGTGLALIDSTYVDNAADALVAALSAAPRLGGTAMVVSNGEPRTVRELVCRIVSAAGLAAPRISVPPGLAFAGGLLLEGIWRRRALEGDPPMTGFLAEQLSTAHWFDQRDTRTALEWSPTVGIDEGFSRLASWYSSGGLAAASAHS